MFISGYDQFPLPCKTVQMFFCFKADLWKAEDETGEVISYLKVVMVFDDEL